MATITDSDETWTALPTGVSLPAATEPNTPDANNLAFPGTFDTPLPELNTFIELGAAAYGTGYWAFAAFVKHQLTALFTINANVPRIKDVA